MIHRLHSQSQLPTVLVREALMSRTIPDYTNMKNSNRGFRYDDIDRPKNSITLTLMTQWLRYKFDSIPRMGHLSMVVSSFRQDSLLHGTRLFTNSIISSTVDHVYVQYTFDRNMTNRSANLIVQNHDVKDYFYIPGAGSTGVVVHGGTC